jgi:hypothetical protein
MTHEWMTREEWAIVRTTVYAGDENPKPASTRLSDYASAEGVCGHRDVVPPALKVL